MTVGRMRARETVGAEWKEQIEADYASRDVELNR
jgi:hypothetical protein